MIDSEKKGSITQKQFETAFLDKIDALIQDLFVHFSKIPYDSVDIDTVWQICC